jgi:hypothetical protein
MNKHQALRFEIDPLLEPRPAQRVDPGAPLFGGVRGLF